MLSGKYISESIGTRQNNLDIIRFIAASLVLYSHAFPLATGNNGSETLAVLTKGQMTFGDFAVSIFFIISGFLITQSYERSQNLVSYLKARALRIFPGLIFVLLFSMFILGPIFTDLSLIEYLKNRETYHYFKSVTLYWLEVDLPGVFMSNTWPGAINGSIWTLWYEFFFYLVVAVLGVTRLLNKYVALILFILCSYLHLSGYVSFYSDLFRYFSAGMLFYFFRDKIKLNVWVALVSLVVLVYSVQLGYFRFAFTGLGAYIVFYLAFETRLRLHNFGRFGDFSYGIYIFAFPIQQMMVDLFNNQMSPMVNFLYSFPITLILAIISWHLVEKRALKYKKTSLRELLRNIPYVSTKAKASQGM